MGHTVWDVIAKFDLSSNKVMILRMWQMYYRRCYFALSNLSKKRKKKFTDRSTSWDPIQVHGLSE